MKIQIHKDNWQAGRDGYKVRGVVIHIMQGTLIGTDSWFNTAGSYVSSHDGIGKNGDLHEYVGFNDTAYHAGRVNQPIWAGMQKNVWGSFINPNKYTYGIECEGYRGQRWTEPQMVTLVNRVKYALDQAGLTYSRAYIISHHEITADKENMTEWCDEVVRRLNTPVTVPQPPDKVAQARELLKQALALIS